MISSGSAVNPHLHFEVHIGTCCSLEWSLANPNADLNALCNPQEYDPHVHPFLVFPNMAATNVVTSITQNLTALADGILHTQTSDTSPNFNKFLVQVVNNMTSSVCLFHLLDLNLRTGFNATSTVALHTQNKTAPYLEPEDFGLNSIYWKMNLIIPTLWVSLNSYEHIIITLTVVWGVELPQIILQYTPMSLAPAPSPTLSPMPFPMLLPTVPPMPSLTKAPTQCRATDSPCNNWSNCCSNQCHMKRCA